ncbi:hypothetical protein CFC21_056661 [Triticum aestivum]|uniref:Uncharacterized protein n=3 Tax=Triticum TaxID=4564 RepID=A0A9R0SVW9_TRITD|nr:uncharacterized protein LOC119295028 [Triticum dicoccoides]XP_044368395.1 uncharacterized protein LOC123091061 isoform X2 [Triticum aestivum]KAF7047782.1 hypothetical protein CFC21_056661 [Triticum aestivum]VAI02333.1 unnamed protein product [Triticum turgidum subsp. durum]
MEIPRSLGVQDNEEEEEYDSVFYEDIEAPKFVDLTAPDAACPADDPSWFCLRVGCDQSHEHVDPEALHRSFVMRVMAARSPNVRLHKAISRRNQSSTLPKCPHSAPAKPPRTRMTRLSLATGAAEKAARDRLQGHRIRGLRDSPVRTKAARVEASSARKKALTTPRSKTVRPRQEPFLSVKHQKGPVATAAAEIKGTVVKALFMSTPKKETPAKSQAPPVAEVCSKMKKLNLACREVPSRYLSQLPTPKIAKKCEETAAVVKSAKRVQEPRNGKKKMILGCSAKCANAETDKENRSGRENINADENSCKRTARRNWGQEPKEVVQGSRVEVVEPLQPDIHGDDKENAPCGDQLAEQALNREDEEDENSKQSENSENAPQKVLKRQNKVVNAEQGGKLKKNTILRPFRLRTDERQVLKDAIPERKPTVAEKNIMPALKGENRRVMQTGRCPDGKEREKLTCGEKQRKQITYTATSRLGESKTVLSSIRPNNVRPALTKGKTVEKSQRAASSTRTAKITSGFTAPSQTGEKRKASMKTSRLQAAAA